MMTYNLPLFLLLWAELFEYAFTIPTDSTSSGTGSPTTSSSYPPYGVVSPAYSDTDSKESPPGRTVAPGTMEFHKGKYTLYSGKIAYHHELSNQFQTEAPNLAKEHEKEIESAYVRKQKHADWITAISQGKMTEGKKHKLPKPFPVPPSEKEAKILRKSAKVSWNTEKGFNHLLASKLPPQQRRSRRKEESKSDSSSSSSSATSNLVSPQAQTSRSGEHSGKRQKFH